MNLTDKIKLIIIGDGVFFGDTQKIHNGMPENDKHFYLTDEENQNTNSENYFYTSTQDGFGIKDILKYHHNIPTVFVLEKCNMPQGYKKRLNKLGYSDEEMDKHFHYNVNDKFEKLKDICKDFNVKPNEILYMDNSLNFDNPTHKSIKDSVHKIVKSKNSEKTKILDVIETENIRKYTENNAPANAEDLYNLYLSDGKPCDGMIREFVNKHFPAKLYNEDKNILMLESIKEHYSHYKKVVGLILDIDGTMTNAGFYFSETGKRAKRFSINDFYTLKALSSFENMTNKDFCVIPFFITSDKTLISHKFVESVGLNPFMHLFQGKKNEGKLLQLQNILHAYGIQPEDTAYAGDDGHCYYLLKSVIASGGKGFCPKDAMPEIKGINNVEVLQTNGGDGIITNIIQNLQKDYSKSIEHKENIKLFMEKIEISKDKYEFIVS